VPTTTSYNDITLY